jgi:hypothetical protein
MVFRQITEMIYSRFNMGSVLDAQRLVDRVMNILCPPRENTLNLHEKCGKAPENGAVLFLFNGVP